MKQFDEGDVRAILTRALSRGAEFAELYYERTASTTVTLIERSIKGISSGVMEGVGIRVVRGDTTGYAYTDDFALDRLKEAADVASYVAERGGEAPIPVFSPSRTGPLAPIQEPAVNVDLARKVEILVTADDAARSTDGRIGEVQCAYGDAQRSMLVANSEGRWVENEDQLMRFSVTALGLENGRRESGVDFIGGRYGFEEMLSRTPQDAGKRAARQAITKLGARPAPAGQYPVIVDAGWGGVLVHEGVGHGLEGDFNRKGTSIYAGQLGHQVASPLVTIVDDGTVPHARGSLAVDDEGEPMQRTVLIKDGVLVGFLYDWLNARLMKTASTGSGRRESYRHVPLPRMRNTFIDAGKDDPEDLVRSVKKGVKAQSLGGGQVDIVSGNFVFEIQEGYLIEDGRVTAPIRGANLIGNGPEAMKKVAGVGRNLEIERRVGSCGKEGQYVPVGVGQPTILISEMTIGGTQT